MLATYTRLATVCTHTWRCALKCKRIESADVREFRDSYITNSLGTLLQLRSIRSAHAQTDVERCQKQVDETAREREREIIAGGKREEVTEYMRCLEIGLGGMLKCEVNL